MTANASFQFWYCGLSIEAPSSVLFFKEGERERTDDGRRPTRDCFKSGVEGSGPARVAVCQAANETLQWWRPRGAPDCVQRLCGPLSARGRSLHRPPSRR